MKRLRIGKVADRAGVSVDTVRYYESRGLIDEPPRKSTEYRQYHPQVAERIKFIKGAQDLGFTLSDIQELLTLKDSADASCEDVRTEAEGKLEEIENKISALQGIKSRLEDLIEACARKDRESVDACPIIHSMEVDNES